MIQLIAIDLDGTLLHEDKTLSKGNIEALHRAHEAGYDIVICTGRPLAGVRPIFEEIGLPDGNYYMIINNGCTTLSTQNWEIIGKEELSLEDMHRLQVLTEDTDVQLTLFDMDHYLVVAPEASELVTMDAGIVNSKPTLVSEEDLPNLVPIFQAMYVGEPSAIELAGIIASLGLAQNFAALKALVTTGIQAGHMKLQARSLALLAGAKEEEVPRLVSQLLENKPFNLEKAQTLLQELRK